MGVLTPGAAGRPPSRARLRYPVSYLVSLLVVAVTVSSESRAESSAQEAARLRRDLTIENWDDGGERTRFAYLNISQMFTVAVVRRAGPVLPLQLDADPAIGRFVVMEEGDRRITLDEWLSNGPLDGFLVLHRGRIVYERYPRMRPEDKHLMFSVTKAFVGTMVALLEERGLLSVDRPVGELIPELRESAWREISIRDILEMASGIEGPETGPEAYSDPHHKHYLLEASLGWLPKSPDMPAPVQREETYEYLRTLRRVREPGTRREYASVNTAVLGWLVERITGRTLAEALTAEFWSRMGAEADALLVVNRNGIPVAHAGMAATLRDLGRFGLLFAHRTGAGADNRVIPDRVLRRIVTGGRPRLFESVPHPEWLTRAAYQWDGVTDKGDFFKGGFADQMLYVAPRKDVVIAYFGTNESLESGPHPLPLRRMVDDLFP